MKKLRFTSEQNVPMRVQVSHTFMNLASLRVQLLFSIYTYASAVRKHDTNFFIVASHTIEAEEKKKRRYLSTKRRKKLKDSRHRRASICFGWITNGLS